VSEFIKNAFPNNKILLEYKSGSYAYELNSDYSDNDYVVVLDNFLGMLFIPKDELNNEYFIYGKAEWIKRQELDTTLSSYHKLFIDDIMNIDNTKVEVNTGIKTILNNYLKRDWTTILIPYLKNVVSYFRVFLDNNELSKLMYHLYRIEEQVNNFLISKKWSIELSNDTKDKVKVYKENYHSQSSVFVVELKQILNHFETIIKEDNNE
jgi:hypothetical protein